jgi:hypothetical protein
MYAPLEVLHHWGFASLYASFCNRMRVAFEGGSLVSFRVLLRRSGSRVSSSSL